MRGVFKRFRNEDGYFNSTGWVGKRFRNKDGYLYNSGDAFNRFRNEDGYLNNTMSFMSLTGFVMRVDIFTIQEMLRKIPTKKMHQY